MVAKFRACRWRCSRWPRRCSPTRRSSRASRPASSPPAPTSGPTPIRTAPACWISCSRTASASTTYARYALDVPMYFVKRDGRYIDARRPLVPRLHGRRACRCCRASGRPSRTGPTTSPPCSPRCGCKNYLEMRGADTGPPGAALRAAGALDGPALRRRRRWPPPGTSCKDWKIEDHERLRADAARLGLKARSTGAALQDVALGRAGHRPPRA